MIKVYIYIIKITNYLIIFYKKRAMIKTHENFKSIVPEITNADDIDNIISQNFILQPCCFEKEFSPCVKHLWSDEELNNFHIDLSKIDRVYYLLYVDCHELGDDSRYVLIFRMNYYNKHVYVEMCLDRYWSQGDVGTIFVCLKPNSFFNIILTNIFPAKNMKIEKILKFLKEEDGFSLSDIYDKNLHNNFQTLQSMCIHILYDNSDKMRKHRGCDYFVLPKRVASLLDDYNDYKETYRRYMLGPCYKI